MDLVSSKDISKALKLENNGGELIAKFLMQLLKFNKLNKLYNETYEKEGVEFIEEVIKHLEFDFEVTDEDLKRIPKDKPFIIVANHPFGGIDALILIKIFSDSRPDIKAMGNFLLQKIDPIKDIILPVNPFEARKDAKSSFTGIKNALKHLEDGNSLAIFPAGEVSSYQSEMGVIQDREWQNSILKFIKKASVPVVPVYFHGTNSRLFHLLGKMHPVLRTAKLPSELFNKKNKKIQVRIGNPIPVKEQNEFSDISHYGRYLRARTYALGTKLEAKRFYLPSFNPKNKKMEEVVPAVDQDKLVAEIETIKKDYSLFINKNYHVICVPSTEIPVALQQIGRLREITFREVGEGTNRCIDIDEFDFYYHQLIIWDNEEKKIVGAYRLGKGKDILAQYGLNGFYLSSLFKIKKEYKTILNESIELGRSFIIKEYQRKPLPLFLLWKGLLFFLLKNTDYRYLIGPVSISNDFSKFSKSLIVEFIKKYHYNEDLAQYIKPRKKFVVKADKNVDRDLLTEFEKGDIAKIDSLIHDIECTYKFPILIKKYLQLNANIIGFNIDPKFNDALDGLLMLDILDVPESFIKALSKELNDESILERFNYSPSMLDSEN